MQRLSAGSVALTAVLALVASTLLVVAPADVEPRHRAATEVDTADATIGGGPTTSAPTRVSLYGDSLAFQAEAAFTAEIHRRIPAALTTSTFPTTALCDYLPAIAADLARTRPEVVVLEFSGNSFTTCMRDRTGAFLAVGSTAWRERYLDDLRYVLAVAGTTSTSVVWATAPPVHHPPAPENYPRLLAAAVRKLSAKEPGLHVAPTGSALTTGDHAFTSTLPCRADEQAMCRDGVIEARNADGLHFDCHGIVGPLGSCLGYSAGAHRFGEALADAAVTTVAGGPLG